MYVTEKGKIVIFRRSSFEIASSHHTSI